MAVAVLAGCGGGGSSGSSNSTAAAKAAKPPASSRAAESTGGEPSAEFVGKGPNGKLAKSGEEAEAADREAASRVVEESLEARASRDWASQCSTLVAALIKQIEESNSLSAATGCAKALAAVAAPATPSALANTMTGPIDALRVSGTQGFAFWHGTGGKDYVIPLFKEGGEWKVGSLVAQEAP